MTNGLGLAIALLLGRPEFLADRPMPPDPPRLEAEDDALPLPAPSRVIASRGEQFFLVLHYLPDQQRSQATLYAADGDRCQSVWQRVLPHAYGPRYALVNDQGSVALVDEWINVRSSQALTVLGPTGRVLGWYPYEALQAVVDFSDAEILAQSQAGWWVSQVPQLENDGQRLTVGVGRKVIRVDLSTGILIDVLEIDVLE